MKTCVLLLLFSFSTAAYGQHITVLDSSSQEPIPFVHVYDGNKGVIASATGAFYWQSNTTDSISLSCMGYATKTIGVDQLKDSLFFDAQNLGACAHRGIQQNLDGKRNHGART